MCSSPKAKRNLIAAKKGYSGSVLSNISADARSRFAQNANKADEKHYLRQREQKQQHQQLQQILSQQSLRQNKASTISLSRIKNKHDAQKPFSYWFFKASFKEIIHLIFLGKSHA